MPRPVGEITLLNFGLDLLALPRGNRTVTRRTITMSVAAVAGATTVTLTSAVAGVVIKAGSSLSFIAPSGAIDRQQVLFTEDVTVGTTNTTAFVSSLRSSVALNSTASFVDGVKPLFGVQTFELSQTDTTVDTTSTQSGSGTEMAMIRAGRIFQISGIEVPYDLQLQEVKKFCRDSGFFGREFFSVLTYPDGETFEGATKITNFSQPGNQNEVKRYSFQLALQGDAIWRSSYF
jgi:hypothetical protein